MQNIKAVRDVRDAGVKLISFFMQSQNFIGHITKLAQKVVQLEHLTNRKGRSDEVRHGVLRGQQAVLRLSGKGLGHDQLGLVKIFKLFLRQHNDAP